jgi:tripartite ATP-independent transporter DctM subunit
MEIALILLVLLLILILKGVTVAFAMALSGMIGLLFFGDPHLLTEVGRTMWWTSDSWVMLCIPLFSVMAEFMSKGKLADRLFEGVSKLTAGFRGSLFMAVVSACALMGLSTGGGIGEIVSIGRLSIPSMLSRGYQKGMTLGSVASSSVLGFLIPPSIFLVVYGSLTGLSVAEMFAATLVPGAMMAFFFLIAIAVCVRINPKLAPASPSLPIKERLGGFMSLWPIMIVGVTVVGGIFTGAATPTEIAGIGALLALGVVMIIPSSRKLLGWNYFKESLGNSVKLTAAIMLIITGAQTLGFAWTYLGVQENLSQWVVEQGFPPAGIMIAIYVIMIVGGCLMDGMSLLVLSTPMLLPLAETAGYDPIWFGVMQGMLIACGQITPPVGMGLYTVKTIYPEHDFGAIIRGTIPFLIAEIACIAVNTACPEISLWLPRILYPR